MLINDLYYKVSLKLAVGCKVEDMAELLVSIPGVQLVGQRSAWLNYRCNPGF